jgi:staphylococcal nuclease domain-containing protein 1
VFRVDYQLEQAGNKEFGTVFVNEKENVAVSLVGAGLAKVRTPGGSQSAFYDELVKAAADAEAKGLGVHTKDREAAAAAVRDLLSQDGGCRCLPGCLAWLAAGGWLLRNCWRSSCCC